MMEIQLTNGDSVLVDDEDYWLLMQSTWHCFDGNTVTTKYAYSWNPYPTAILMHRLVMNTPKGFVTDHIDGNGLNNQKPNLRNVTYSQNAHNRKDHPKGCYYEFDRKKWHSKIMIDGKSIFLGRFDSEEEASITYNLMHNKFFGPEQQPETKQEEISSLEDEATKDALTWSKLL